jgi:hypothetical protein
MALIMAARKWFQLWYFIIFVWWFGPSTSSWAYESSLLDSLTLLDHLGVFWTYASSKLNDFLEHFVCGLSACILIYMYKISVHWLPVKYSMQGQSYSKLAVVEITVLTPTSMNSRMTNSQHPEWVYPLKWIIFALLCVCTTNIQQDPACCCPWCRFIICTCSFWRSPGLCPGPPLISHLC